MKIVITEQKYPRKGSEYSIWVAESEFPLPDMMPFGDALVSETTKLLVCVHSASPANYLPMIQMVAKAMRSFISTPEGQAEVLEVEKKLN